MDNSFQETVKVFILNNKYITTDDVANIIANSYKDIYKCIDISQLKLCNFKNHKWFSNSTLNSLYFLTIINLFQLFNIYLAKKLIFL